MPRGISLAIIRLHPIEQRALADPPSVADTTSGECRVGVTTEIASKRFGMHLSALRGLLKREENVRCLSAREMLAEFPIEQGLQIRYADYDQRLDHLGTSDVVFLFQDFHPTENCQPEDCRSRDLASDCRNFVVGLKSSDQSIDSIHHRSGESNRQRSVINNHCIPPCTSVNCETVTLLGFTRQSGLLSVKSATTQETRNGGLKGNNITTAAECR